MATNLTCKQCGYQDFDYEPTGAILTWVDRCKGLAKYTCRKCGEWFIEGYQ